MSSSTPVLPDDPKKRYSYAKTLDAASLAKLLKDNEHLHREAMNKISDGRNPDGTYWIWKYDRAWGPARCETLQMDKGYGIIHGPGVTHWANSDGSLGAINTSTTPIAVGTYVCVGNGTFVLNNPVAPDPKTPKRGCSLYIEKKFKGAWGKTE